MAPRHDKDLRTLKETTGQAAVRFVIHITWLSCTTAQTSVTDRWQSVLLLVVQLR